MGIKVVLKQYKGNTFHEIVREIKLFTQLENERNKSQAKQTLNEMILQSKKHHDALPQLLGYKVKEGEGELLMTHGGLTLDKWEMKLHTK